MRLWELYDFALLHNNCNVVEIDETFVENEVDYEHVQRSLVDLDAIVDSIQIDLKDKSQHPIVVACAFTNSLAGIVAFLFCVKNHLIYYPVNPKAEFQEIISNLKSLNVGLLLHENVIQPQECSHEVQSSGSFFGGRINAYVLDAYNEAENEVDSLKLSSEGSTRHLLEEIAYVISTSGTTGAQKHVLVSHPSIMSNVDCVTNRLQLCIHDVIAQNTNFMFDPCFIEILCWLKSGCTLVLYPTVWKLQPHKFGKLVRRLGVTFLQTTPSTILNWGKENIGKYLLSKDSTLRVLALGGENWSPHLLSFKSTDNKTRVFNFYGLTEMSCWATIHEVLFDAIGRETSQSETSCDTGEVPVGEAMYDTELRFDPHEQSTDLFKLVLLSKKRSCTVLSNSENLLQMAATCHHRLLFPEVTAVETNDLFQKVKGQFYFRGRCDNEVKQLGQRFNLDWLKVLIIRFENEFCKIANCAVVHHNSRIHCFLQLNSPMNLELCAHFEKNIRIYLLRQIPEIFVPHSWTYMSALPCNRNGKVDVSILKRMIQIAAGKDQGSPTVSQTSKQFEELVVEVFDRNEESIDWSLGFLSNGGTSLKAFYVTHHLKPICTFDNAEELILQLLLADVSLNFVKSQCEKLSRRSGNECDQKNCSRGSIEVEEMWSVDMELCVDAAAISNDSQSTIFVGSHSGLFVALDILDDDSMKLRWSLHLSDRILSSAAVSRDAKYVIVGCSSGLLRVILTASSEIVWRFQAKSMIKCSPVIDSKTDSIVYCCSYDSRVYALDFRCKACLWACEMSSAITSSPSISDTGSSAQLLLCVDLNGLLAVLNTELGVIEKRVQLEKPVFSDILQLGSLVLICQVNGCVCCYQRTQTDLKLQWTYQITSGANVFNKPFYLEEKRLTFIPDSSGVVTILDAKGQLFSRIDTGLNCCLSSPVVVKCTGEKKSETTKELYFVGSCGSLAKLTLDSHRNQDVQIVQKFPFEIFAPLLLLRNRLLIFGSHDDKLHCLKIN